MEQAITELYDKASVCPKAYSVGDIITVNNEQYYVISDSVQEQDYVVAVKIEPLTVNDINLYGGAGTGNNHVNKFTQDSIGTSSNWHGYGTAAYYTSETCGYANGSLITTGCSADYALSDVKYIVDNWAQTVFDDDELKLINGYNARLITKDEVLNICGSLFCSNSSNTWIYNANYRQWTMSAGGNGQVVYYINDNGLVYSNHNIYTFVFMVIRPVINVYKSAITRINNN